MKSDKSIWWLGLCTWFVSRHATQDFLTLQDLGGLSSHGVGRARRLLPSLSLCVCSQSRTTACQHWQRPHWQAKARPHTYVFVCVWLNNASAAKCYFRLFQALTVHINKENIGISHLVKHSLWIICCKGHCVNDITISAEEELLTLVRDNTTTPTRRDLKLSATFIG